MNRTLPTSLAQAPPAAAQTCLMTPGVAGNAIGAAAEPPAHRPRRHWLPNAVAILRPVRALPHRAGALVERIFLSALAHFPIPSEVKWQHMVNFIRTFTLEYYNDLAGGTSPSLAQTTVARVLSASGFRWARGFHEERGPIASPPALAELLSHVFRTLDIDSTVAIGKDAVVVTNHRCPYLAMGLDRGVEGPTVCSIICGAKTSFVQGITLGLPARAEYQSETAIGHGDEACVKRFSPKA